MEHGKIQAGEHDQERNSALYQEIDENFAAAPWYYEIDFGRPWVDREYD